MLNRNVLAYLQTKIEAIKEHYSDLVFKERNSDQDHIHLLISIPPQWTAGTVVGIIKPTQPGHCKPRSRFLKELYWGTDSSWSEGYFVSMVGIYEDVIRAYLEAQSEEDRRQSNLKWL